MSNIAKLGWLALACPLYIWAQSGAAAGTPAQITVTVGHHYGHEPPVLTPADLILTEHFAAMPITSVVPLRGGRAGLELFILVDQCSNCEPGSKFQELRAFIGSQPFTTAVGIAYIAGGHLQIAEKPTLDRERAVKALNTPAGSKPASPFGALAELVQSWPQTSSRRAVLMISNGMDPAAKGLTQTPSADAAIETAQRAGVTVYAIYHPSADYGAADPSELYAGQVGLAHLAMETGGEAYFLGFGPMPSLAPFLTDIADHLANQYTVEFLAESGASFTGFQTVSVRSQPPGLELMAPATVWVPVEHPVGTPTGEH